MLGITPSTWDTEIEAIRDDQEATIDTHLTNYTTVPLATVPTEVSRICAELCRVEFRFRRAADTEALNVLRKMREVALADLDAYITKTYPEDVALISVEDRDVYE